MMAFTVRRKYWHVCLLVLCQITQLTAEPQFDSGSFIDTDEDLLAMASDDAPQVERSGPVTSYADPFSFDANAPVAAVAPPPSPPPQGQPQQPQTQQSGSQIISNYVSQPIVQPTVLQPSQIQQSSSQTFPFYGGVSAAVPFYDIGIPAQVPYEVPVAVAAPVVVGPPTTVYVPNQYHAVEVLGAQLSQNLVGHAAGFLEIYNYILKHPHKALELLFMAAQRLAVPKDHYMNVISFVGVYLFMSYLFYSTEDVSQLTCEIAGGNKKSIHKEWFYHAGRRFVPALPGDKKTQKQFLKLFRGPHLEDDASGSSSEEDFSGELNVINELMPKGSFFYSMSPVHIEAIQALQRIFVLQKSSAEVMNLARDLLYHQKVHPKLWYLALVAAARERPDMGGVPIPHPLDAVPDWFIPGHLIKDEMERYRSITDKKHIGRRIKRGADVIQGGNSTYIRSMGKAKLKYRSISYANESTTTAPTSTQRPDSAETSGEYVGLDGSVISSSSSKNNQDAQRRKGEENEETVEVNENMLKDLRYSLEQKRAKAQQNGGSGGKGVRPDKKKKGSSGDHKHKKGKGHKGKGHKGKGEEEECIRVDGRVGIDNGIENKLWYWREDIQANQHHWYWHQFNPLNATQHPDRRAELFFFMHRSLLARYNAERLSNGLHRTYELDFHPGGIIHEGYNSHLVDLASGIPWAARSPKRTLTDIIHLKDPNIARNILFPDLLEVYGRLINAIKTGKMVNRNGKLVKISNSQGIEPLANTVEASELSVNPFFYDTFGLHNAGHLVLSLVSDPLYKRHLAPGVLGDQATGMRDPAFYPYHVFLDNIFEKFKTKLAPYKVLGGEWPLLWRGVEIHHVEILSKGNNAVNQLRTFWTDHKFELAPGVDRSVDVEEAEQGKVCAIHLSHEPFLFKFVIERKPCARSKTSKATIRIFMAPRYDEKGRRLFIEEQRRLMFQLDAFQAKLRGGKNVITRRSHDSSLTKPWSRSLKEMQALAGQGGAADFCGCGWPQHLYIPKGTPKGMAFDLFVMATNYDEDKVIDSPQDLKIPETCNSPYIFCGLPRRRYPDARPMNYPFDRKINNPLLPCRPGHSFGSMVCQSFNMVFLKQIDTLEQFVSRAPNMKSLTFTIKHIDHFYGWSSHNQGGGGGEGGNGDENNSSDGED